MPKAVRPEPLPLEIRNAVLFASMKQPAAGIREADALVWRWLPWLLSFSGARAAEIIVAQGDDFLETYSHSDASIPCLRLRSDSAAGKDRMMPIHPGLTEMGLLDMARQHIGKRPFLDDGQVTNAAVKGALARYRRRLAKIDIGQDPLGATHSGFRHSFARELVHANATPEIIDALLGRRTMPSEFDDGTSAFVAGAAALARIPMPALH